MASADFLSRLSPVRKNDAWTTSSSDLLPELQVDDQQSTNYFAFSIKKLSSLWFDDLLAHEGYSSQHDRSPAFSIIDLYIGAAVSVDTGSGKGNQLVTTLAGRLKACILSEKFTNKNLSDSRPYLPQSKCKTTAFDAHCT
ncbi:uncharacterized protein EAE98_005283 [Botrytis deweyae]|uniref:Uncharacterized protein n=1 Tax=Botrytis deweyae TaxID=2478750 RepID=A0ABQ7INF5_9HELO|nr:uncharacterized protein EAE98_005283 [Botrytis deweyae]KAF7929365.1 hypothetical protein EAE98_005283 [Botrytis deweyae]